MQVPILAFGTPASRRKRVVSSLIAALLVILASATAFPDPAGAITRDEVIRRAERWVDAGVMYSQSSYHEGYRQDCSGMVSMAWDTGTSYTSSSIRSQGERVSKGEALPGDAIRWPGHVEIFAGWTDEDMSGYIALAETNWGKPALRKTRRWQGHYEVWRYGGIEEDAVAAEESRLPEKMASLDALDAKQAVPEPIGSLAETPHEWAEVAGTAGEYPPPLATWATKPPAISGAPWEPRSLP